MKKNSVFYAYIKRVLDFTLAVIFLIIFLIPMAIIALAIKMEGKGPVLFKQDRTGKNGKTFKLYKFRSMSVSNNVLDFNIENKLTKVGALLRKTSIDELPQLLNIIKGEMSFIGPRPWIPEYYNNFTDSQKKRTLVSPGITGLAQACGRNNLSVLDKISYDIKYIENYSLLTDLKVVFLTIKTVLTKEGIEQKKSGIRDEIEDLKFNYLHVTGPIPIVNSKQYKDMNKKVNI